MVTPEPLPPQVRGSGLASPSPSRRSRRETTACDHRHRRLDDGLWPERYAYTIAGLGPYGRSVGRRPEQRPDQRAFKRAYRFGLELESVDPGEPESI